MSALDQVDVLVIGAGASGAVIALTLAEAGLRVVCLDQGGWTEPAQHPHFGPDFVHRRFTDWNPEATVRAGPADYPVLGDQSHALMWNGIGGSTNAYAALWPRLRPSDFRKGREHGLAPDWPISYDDLAPFYDEADALIGISGLAGDPGMPPRPPYPCAPLPLRDSGRVIATGFERLGWHWWPMPVGTISEPYQGRAACNGCGNCASGCPRGSMAKLSLTLWPRALAAGVRLRPGARVRSIETDRAGTATGAIYIDRATGQTLRQTADRVVLAANGVGTPRLLLLSDTARHPNGLANGNDVVGRYLLHHTLVAAEIWVDAPIRSYIGNSGALISSEFAETDPARGFVNGFNFNVTRTGPAGAAAIGAFGARPTPWGAAHHADFARRLGHGFGAYAIGDDLPQATNRITLDPTETDGDGLPAARLHYVPHENDCRMMRFGIDRLRDLATSVDAFDVAINDYMENDVYRTPAWHMLGTCRMGTDPATSTVNRWHRAWEVPHLYVCDGSSFASGGVVNPTSTVTALALRCARHLVSETD